MSKAYKRFLQTYKRDKARLKQITNELQYITMSQADPSKEPVQSNEPSNPTFKQVTRREKLREEYDHLYYRVQTVENLLDAISENQRELIKMRYMDDMTPAQICILIEQPRHHFYYEMGKVYDIFEEILGIRTKV